VVLSLLVTNRACPFDSYCNTAVITPANATSPAALPEKSGPYEVAIDARKSSAKLPDEQAPSVIGEPPAADAAYALGIICYSDGAATVAAAIASAVAIRVPVKITFALILSMLFTVDLQEILQKMTCD
jgi:hypothetical protein